MEEFRQGLRELKAEEKWRGGDNNRGGLPKRDPSLGLQRSEKPRKSEGSTEKVGCEIGKSGGHENRRRKIWRKRLSQRRRDGEIPWSDFLRLERRYGLPKPRVVHSLLSGAAKS